MYILKESQFENFCKLNSSDEGRLFTEIKIMLQNEWILQSYKGLRELPQCIFRPHIMITLI